MIELQHISKRFGPVAALDDVSLTIMPGRILGLLGENGAGKSTLMNVLFGLTRADGTIRLPGQPVKIPSPRAAQALGIGMVHQHFKLVPTLSAEENFSLFMPGSRRQLGKLAQEWLTRLGWSLPLQIPVRELSVGQQQRVEIVKALMGIATSGGKAATLILDEPTAVLTPQEAKELFAAMRQLRDARDGAAVVFISHKLNEVRDICDDVAILRRGKLIHHGKAAEISIEETAEKMVGTRVEIPRLLRNVAQEPTGVSTDAVKARLELRQISTPVLQDVNLQVKPGEIMGIAGVDGNGQSHLAQVILNTLVPARGDVLFGNTVVNARSTRERLGEIAFIAEDRQKEALVLPLSVQENLLLKDYRTKKFSTLGWMRFAAWRSHSRELMRQFDIRADSPAATVGRLSGGNQQKVVLARELHAADKSIVLAVNPTRGLDVGATAFVLQKLLDARARGAAVLLIHSDLDELLAVSDRIAVLFNGKLAETPWPHCDKETIGRMMLGLPAGMAA